MVPLADVGGAEHCGRNFAPRWKGGEGCIEGQDPTIRECQVKARLDVATVWNHGDCDIHVDKDGDTENRTLCRIPSPGRDGGKSITDNEPARWQILQCLIRVATPSRLPPHRLRYPHYTIEPDIWNDSVKD